MAPGDELELEPFAPGEGEKTLSVREETQQRAPARARLVHRMGRLLARPAVAVALLGLHVAWIVLNLRSVAWYRPWDPYPFTFLATLASALAPFVSLMILMRQQREAHIAELREEVSLQVSLYSQRQLAASVQMLRELATRLEVLSRVSDGSLERLARPLDPERLMESVRRRLDRAEHEPHE